MTITITLNPTELHHDNLTLSGYQGIEKPKLGNINLNAEDDSEFLPLDHYDSVAISAFLDSEMASMPWKQPRIPRQITGRFRDADGKYIALADSEAKLLAVFLIHPDGSMERLNNIPDVIMSAFD